ACWRGCANFWKRTRHERTGRSRPRTGHGMPLSCSGIHLAYGRHGVLRGVDLHLPRGEVLGLIGRNGAGKSSLIACMLGLLRPQRGQARLFGGPSLYLDDARKAMLGYVPQQPQYFGCMKVAELFGYLAQLYP